jgi:hypothetical protein
MEEVPFPLSVGEPSPHVEIPVLDANGVPVCWVTSAIPDPKRLAAMFSAAPDLLAYAELEAEYTRLCDRTRPDYSPTEFREWIEAHLGESGEPVGRWLGRIRTAAIAKAKGETE